MKKGVLLIYAAVSFFIMSGARPLQPQIRPDENIIFYPAYSYEDGKGGIVCRIHGHISEPEEDSTFRKALIHSILEATEDERLGDDVFNPCLAERIKPFLYDNEGGKKVSISLNGNKIPLDESGDNGHFYGSVTIKGSKIPLKRSIISYTAITEPGDMRNFSGRSYFIPRKGISVISDIDDTIKESNVLDKKQLIKNTFMRKFRPVKGMPALYRRLEKKGTAFHYVSGSPWQLYAPISDFLTESGFPEGSIHLKYMRVKDSSIIDFISADQLLFKVSNIEAILNDFPERRFILIGDSGEHDPEVYTEIAEGNPGRIIAVFIRNVNRPGDTDERYSRLTGMKKSLKFRLFRAPAELSSMLKSIH